MNKNIQSFSITSWLLKTRTVLLQKDPAKGNSVGNYHPKASLNLSWKLKISVIAYNLYQHLENENLLLEKHKGCSNIAFHYINDPFNTSFKTDKTRIFISKG